MNNVYDDFDDNDVPKPALYSRDYDLLAAAEREEAERELDDRVIAPPAETAPLPPVKPPVKPLTAPLRGALPGALRKPSVFRRPPAVTGDLPPVRDDEPPPPTSLAEYGLPDERPSVQELVAKSSAPPEGSSSREAEKEAERLSRSAPPPKRVSEPPPPMYIAGNGRVTMRPEWVEYLFGASAPKAAPSAEENIAAYRKRGWVPPAEGDIPGRRLVFDDFDGEVEEDPERSGPIGGPHRLRPGDWTSC